ncbi:MAG: hypothetical protein M3Q49_20715 [Actinomycetota bacterium]|nr:hypothetical protein [Actinomycetota bacterium]
MSRRRRSTIGASPLDAVVPKRAGKSGKDAGQSSPREPDPATPNEKPKAKQPSTPNEKPRRRSLAPVEAEAATQEERLAVGKKERLTVHVPPHLVNRVKNAVYWTPGLTLARLAEEALLAEVERREKGQGGPFPARAEELRGGRPMK